MEYIFSKANNYKIIRYIFAGGSSTISNLMILYICVHYFKLWYLISAVISFTCAVIISYLLQKFFVFKNYSTEKMHMQFLNFFVYNLIMLGVNTILMYIFVDKIGLWYLLAQAIAAIITAFINYNYFNRVIFIES